MKREGGIERERERKIKTRQIWNKKNQIKCVKE